MWRGPPEPGCQAGVAAVHHAAVQPVAHGVELLTGPESLLAGQRPEELEAPSAARSCPGVEGVVLGDEDGVAASVIAGGVAGRAVYQAVVGTCCHI